MVGGIALLAVLAKHMFSSITNMMRETFTNLNPASLDTSSIIGLLYPYFRYLGIIVVPFLVLIAIIAIVVIRMDVECICSGKSQNRFTKFKSAQNVR